MNIIDEAFVKSKLPGRAADAHKGDFGRVLVYAGSVGMAGAAALCGRSVLRSGAGLTQFLVPELDPLGIFPILQTLVPEATCVDGNNLDLANYSAIAAGPGLGTSKDAEQHLLKIIRNYRGVLVLDADALNMLSASDKLRLALAEASASGLTVIMTPHIGEARRLLYDATREIKTEEQRIQAALGLSSTYNSIVVLKGAGTLITDNRPLRSGEPLISRNTSGNPGMATGGSGDVLTGIIAGLAGQGIAPYDAACMGVWIHGRAGDIAAAKLSQISLISSDLPTFLPEVFSQLTTYSPVL